MYAGLINHLTPKDHFSGRTAPLTSRSCIFLFIQQIYVLNILNMLQRHHIWLFTFLTYFQIQWLLTRNIRAPEDDLNNDRNMLERF